MVLASDLAGRIAGHFREYGMKDNVRHEKDTSMLSVLGFDFYFNVDGKEFDVVISPPSGKEESFDTYFPKINDRLDDPRYASIKHKQNDYRKHILVPEFQKNGVGKYHFRCRFASNNPERATYGVLAYAISPILTFTRIK